MTTINIPSSLIISITSPLGVKEDLKVILTPGEYWDETTEEYDDEDYDYNPEEEFEEAAVIEESEIDSSSSVQIVYIDYPRELKCFNESFIEALNTTLGKSIFPCKLFYDIVPSTHWQQYQELYKALEEVRGPQARKIKKALLNKEVTSQNWEEIASTLVQYLLAPVECPTQLNVFWIKEGQIVELTISVELTDGSNHQFQGDKILASKNKLKEIELEAVVSLEEALTEWFYFDSWDKLAHEFTQEVGDRFSLLIMEGDIYSALELILTSQKKQTKQWTYKKSTVEELSTLWEESKASLAVPILKETAQAIVEYAPERAIVCMARDFLWLYALLCQTEVPCYLYPFSRLQIGDTQSVKVLVDELLEQGYDPAEVVFLDSQGKGSIYDYLQKELGDMGYQISNEQFVFVRCQGEKYPSLLPHYSCEEIIQTVEHGLYHLVGRSMGFIDHSCWEGKVVKWDNPDTNLDKSLLTDHRIQLAKELGLPSFWSGVTGYSKGERTWGLTQVQREVVLRVPSEEVVELVKEQGYLTLREVNYSMGNDTPGVRNELEFESWGVVTAPRYGAVEYSGSNAAYYGSWALVLNPKAMVVCTMTRGDSLCNRYKLEAPTSIGQAELEVDKYLEVQVHSILNGDSFLGYYTPEKEFVAF